jgi:hypothetical protein
MRLFIYRKKNYYKKIFTQIKQNNIICFYFVNKSLSIEKTGNVKKEYNNYNFFWIKKNLCNLLLNNQFNLYNFLYNNNNYISLYKEKNYINFFLVLNQILNKKNNILFKYCIFKTEKLIINKLRFLFIQKNLNLFVFFYKIISYNIFLLKFHIILKYFYLIYKKNN